MTWRTVVIRERAKLSYKNEYMIVRSEEVKMIHLSEIHTLLIESTAVSITSYLLSELIKHKIKVIFCDEVRNPAGELTPLYGSHDSSKRIFLQLAWDEETKQKVWTEIIKQKIINQANLLSMLNKPEAKKLFQYVDELTLFDTTNREGHAAKVYFNALFGKGFNRDLHHTINAGLDYGYTILLTMFNREIAKSGYLTQLGMKHKNYFNHFNLSSDLMEPFRPIVDWIVYNNQDKSFKNELKYDLIQIYDMQILLDNKTYFLTNAVQQYVAKIIKAIETQDLSHLLLYEWKA